MEKMYEYSFRYICDDSQEDMFGAKFHLQAEVIIKVRAYRFDDAFNKADMKLLNICNERKILYHEFDLDSFTRELLA